MSLKYISDSDLESISSRLDRREMGAFTLDGRILLFSFKDEDTMSHTAASMAVADEPGSSGVFDFASSVVPGRPRSASVDSVSSSSSLHFQKVRRGKSRSGSLSDLGDFTGTILLKYCQEALNTAFPDFDFSITKADQFKDEGNCDNVIRKINQSLSELTVTEPDILAKLWGSINACMDLQKCDAYSYTPPPQEDPFGHSALWSFHYFFICKEKEKVCYFTCIASNKLLRQINPYSNDDDGNLSISDSGGDLGSSQGSQDGDGSDGMNDLSFEDEGMSGVSDSDSDHMEVGGI